MGSMNFLFPPYPYSRRNLCLYVQQNLGLTAGMWWGVFMIVMTIGNNYDVMMKEDTVGDVNEMQMSS